MPGKQTPHSELWRFSVIVTSTHKGTEVFDTLDEMPVLLRAKCVKAIQSNDSATLVIADAVGKDYIQRVMEEREEHDQAPAAPPGRRALHFAAEAAMCAAAGLVLWLLSVLR